MKVSIESLRNEMEIRYELALKQFYDKLKMQLNNFVDKDDLNNRLYEKLHKREFEKQFDRLNSTCSYLDTKVETAIPAMKHDMDRRLKGKAEQRDLDDAIKEKASSVFVEEIVRRLNKLEEKVARKVRGGESEDSGDSRSRGSMGSRISEEDDENGSDDEERRRKNKSRKEKILKGSASMEDIKKKKGEPGLGAINEEEEKESVHSKSSTKVVIPDPLAQGNLGDQASEGKQSKGSSRVNRNAYPTNANGSGVAGGPVSAEYQAEVDSKFEDVHRTIEDIKDEQTRLQ